MERSSSRIARSVVASTPAKGSSIRISRASWASARARKTRCCCPPESWLICRPAKAAMPTWSRAAIAASRSRRPGRRNQPTLPYRPMVTTSTALVGKSQSTDSRWGT